MSNEKLEHLLRTVDPVKRRFLKKFVTGAAFAVPIIASFSMKDLAQAAEVCSTTVLITRTTTAFVTRTTTITTTTTL